MTTTMTDEERIEKLQWACEVFIKYAGGKMLQNNSGGYVLLFPSNASEHTHVIKGESVQALIYALALSLYDEPKFIEGIENLAPKATAANMAEVADIILKKINKGDKI